MLPGRLLAQLWLAVVVDYSGNVGFVAVLKYVPALVVAASMLLGPLVASSLGVLLGVEAVPGPWTLLGGVLMLAGSGLIAMRAQRQAPTIDLRGGAAATGTPARSKRPSPARGEAS